MASIATFTVSGAKSSVVPKLPKEVFSIEKINHDLVKNAYVAYLANGRENLAKSKTRGDVSGGGKKPWRQKGTGRARFGSSRVPIWRGGGITHGPTGLENYTHFISLAEKRGALRHALSAKVAHGSLIVIEDLDIKSGKTKDAVKLFDKIGAERNTLVITHSIVDSFKKAVSNIPEVDVVRTKSANVYNVMNADTIVITTGAIDEISEWLGGKK